MAISFRRYVSITSAVGGGAAVRSRDLILRMFSTSTLIPIDTVIEFSGDMADEAATYFGSTSPEYLRTVFYAGFISKNVTAPSKVSFSRWVDADTAPRIYGATGTYAASQFTGVTAGSFNLHLGSHTADVTGMNFSSVTTLSQVAGVVQTAIQAVVAGGAQWTGATVTYNATKQRFELVGGAVGAAPVAIAAAGSGTPIAALLGWTTGAIFSPGGDAEEPVDAFLRANSISDNFGSFAFIDSLSSSQVVSVAAQNDTYNVKYMYTVPIAAADAALYYGALSGYSGVATALTVNVVVAIEPVAETAGTIAEMIPVAVAYIARSPMCTRFAAATTI